MLTVLSKCSELREFSQIHLSEAKQDVLIMLCNEPQTMLFKLAIFPESIESIAFLGKN